ncbi:MAG: hypothetical protein AB1791_15180 [Chloroflexota bacterium]
MLELGLSRRPRFWINSVVLAVIFLWLYYTPPVFLYDRLEKAYYGHYWSGPLAERTNELNIEIRIPQYISSFVANEVLVSVKNITTTEPITKIGYITPTLIIEAEEGVLLMQSEEDRKTSFEGSSVLAFGALPPHASATKSLWLKASPEQSGPVELDFYLVGKKLKPLRPQVPTIIIVNRNKTIAQAFVRTILLPPLANGFLPALALFFSLLLEGSLRSTDKKKTKWKRKIPQNRVQWIFWLKRWSIDLGMSFLLLVLWYLIGALFVWFTAFLAIWYLDHGGPFRVPYEIIGWIVVLIALCAIVAVGVEWVYKKLRHPPQAQPAAPQARQPEPLPVQIVNEPLPVVLVGGGNGPDQPPPPATPDDHSVPGGGDVPAPMDENPPAAPPADQPEPPAGGENRPPELGSYLPILLNNQAEDSIAQVLSIIQKNQPALPEFGRVFTLVQTPGPAALEVLQESVRATGSLYLANCDDQLILGRLLDLYQTDDVDAIRFKDSIGLLDAFVTIASSTAKAVLRERLTSRPESADQRLAIATLVTLKRQAGSKALATSDLLSFANAITPMEGEQFKQIARLLTQTRRRKELFADYEGFKVFLQKDGKTVAQALSGEWKVREAKQLKSLCLDVAVEKEEFAKWFIYWLASLLPESAIIAFNQEYLIRVAQKQQSAVKR